jgi:hypothetical protein
MDFKIEIEDNSGEVLKELESKMPELLNAMGNELYKSITDFMVEDKIVDTGRLKGSISYSTPYTNYKNPSLANTPNDFIQGVNEKDSVVYGSNVEYASYVETGTSRQRARNYIKTGTTRAVPQIKKVVEIILKGEQ